jgi:C1A family cysteine protease
MALEPLDPIELQNLVQAKGLSWTAGETSVSRLPEGEKRIRLGYVPGPAQRNLRTDAAAATRRGAAASYPASFDWRAANGQNYVTSVKDQGGCGSCVAFGVTAAFEGRYQVVRNEASSGIDLSEAQLFYCGGGAAGRNCSNGWWPDPALDYCVNTGLTDEGCFPYTAGDQGCSLCSDAQNRTRNVKAWHAISSTDDMKTWISTNGPVTACFAVYNDFFNYTGGVYKHVSGDLAGGHCVCIIGYDDGQQCWIAKNSWNTTWGDNGFFMIGYGEGKYPDGTGGIDSAMWAVDDIAATGWENGVHVTGLWAIDQDLNAWAYLDGGIGWRKISSDNTNIFFNMLTQLAAAKSSGRPVNIYEEQGVIKQIYVL